MPDSGELRGGAGDGLPARFAQGDGAAIRRQGFGWLDPAELATEPSPFLRADGGRGRQLYRLSGRGWEFQGHGARRCDGCGGYVSADGGVRPESCPLCGHDLR